MQQMAATAPFHRHRLPAPLAPACTVAAICASLTTSWSKERNRWQQPRLFIDIDCQLRSPQPARLPQSVRLSQHPGVKNATDGSNRAFSSTSTASSARPSLHGCRNLCVSHNTGVKNATDDSNRAFSSTSTASSARPSLHGCRNLCLSHHILE